MKQCTKCGGQKSIEQFYKNKSGKFGRAASCIECTNIYMRARHKRSDVKLKKANRHLELQASSPDYRAAAKRRSETFYASLNGRAKTLLAGAKRRVANTSVTIEHITKLLEIGKCPVTGIAFSFMPNYRSTSGRTYNPYAPSIDRIDPKAGYTDQNVRLVIWQYNLMKGELLDGEIFLICNAVVRNFD